MEAVFALLGVVIGMVCTIFVNERRIKHEEKSDKIKLLLSKYEQLNAVLNKVYDFNHEIVVNIRVSLFITGEYESEIVDISTDLGEMEMLLLTYMHEQIKDCNDYINKLRATTRLLKTTLIEYKAGLINEQQQAQKIEMINETFGIFSDKHHEIVNQIAEKARDLVYN